MISRKKTLPLKARFSDLRRVSRQYNSESFSLLCSFVDNNSPLVAFIVSKKVSNLAVLRNRVKRKLSFVVEKKWNELPNNCQLVFLAKKQAIDTSTENLLLELEKVIEIINEQFSK